MEPRLADRAHVVLALGQVSLSHCHYIKDKSFTVTGAVRGTTGSLKLSPAHAGLPACWLAWQ